MIKYIIALLVAFSMSVTSYADVVKDGNTFKVEQTTSTDTKTHYTWQEKDGTKYPIYITKKGACYIIKVSKKTSKPYKRYLPKEIQKQIAQEYGIFID